MWVWKWFIQLVDILTGETYHVESVRDFDNPGDAAQECQDVVQTGGLYRMGLPLSCGIIDAEIYAQQGVRSDR